MLVSILNRGPRLLAAPLLTQAATFIVPILQISRVRLGDAIDPRERFEAGLAAPGVACL